MQLKDQHSPFSALIRLPSLSIWLTTSSIGFLDAKAPPLFCFSSCCPFSSLLMTRVPSSSLKNVDILQTCISQPYSLFSPSPSPYSEICPFPGFPVKFLCMGLPSLSSFLISSPNSASVFLTLKSCFPLGCPIWCKVTQKAA